MLSASRYNSSKQKAMGLPFPLRCILCSRKDGKKNSCFKSIKRSSGRGTGICAPRDGVVTAIETKAGQKTQGTADVMLADSGQNLTAVVTLSSDEESSYVSKDTIVTASSSDGKSADNLAIASIDNREADGTSY